MQSVRNRLDFLFWSSVALGLWSLETLTALFFQPRHCLKNLHDLPEFLSYLFRGDDADESY